MEEQVVQRTNKVGVGVDVFCAHAGCVAIQKYSANPPVKSLRKKQFTFKTALQDSLLPKMRIPSKIEWDLPNGPLTKLLELFDTKV